MNAPRATSASISPSTALHRIMFAVLLLAFLVCAAMVFASGVAVLR